MADKSKSSTSSPTSSKSTGFGKGKLKGFGNSKNAPLRMGRIEDIALKKKREGVYEINSEIEEDTTLFDNINNEFQTDTIIFEENIDFTTDTIIFGENINSIINEDEELTTETPIQE